MSKWLDSLLLAVLQKLCDKFQRLTGLTKFRLQKWAMIISGVFYFMDAIAFVSSHDIDGIRFYIVGTLPFLPAVTALVLMAEKEEKLFLAYGMMLPPYFRSVFSRLVWVAFYIGCTALILFFIVGAINLAGCFTCWILYIYLDAVIPRPPSKSKMREWYEKALIALNDSLKPEPTPVPVPSQ